MLFNTNLISISGIDIFETTRGEVRIRNLLSRKKVNLHENTGTPSLTRFSYSPEFYATRFFKQKTVLKFHLITRFFFRNSKLGLSYQLLCDQPS